MTTPECTRLTLVEAFHDGRLGPQESAAMERHVVGCASCSAMARDLDRIGESLRAPRDPATPLEHQRQKLALLRRATALPQDRAPAWGMRVAFGAVALAAAVLLGWTGASLRAGSAQPSVALHLRTPPRLALARETTLKPSDDARFERTRTAGLEVVTLQTGTLDVTVRPLAAGERFVVRTADAEVEVRGTALRVQASGGKIKSVAVAEGTVEVRYAGFSAVIPSGGSWQATNPDAAPSAPPSAAPTQPAAPPPLAVRSPRVASRVAAAPARTAEPPPAPEAAPAPPAAPPQPSVSPASRAFGDAMAALRRGDFDRGAAALATFSADHAGDARADEADYLRAIALQRAGKSDAAAAAAKQYLATRPAGAHRAEAQQIAGR